MECRRCGQVVSLDAENLSYEETQSALHEALEADLSERGWPGDSKALLATAFDHLDVLISTAEASHGSSSDV